ncbi:uncharacterized protein At3g28850 [Manihot esculenta]|uniref:uncharacterized protein At3g28850 n=1 Tax=Manihot esculenta TaxID=3983 RepID=UPI000B5D747B|nr:uncharacterized protein At3g28850 [Manihot esculenta]
MGCSASKSNTLDPKSHHLQENFSPESSAFTSFSSPVPRALSLQTPLVHHLPSKKGDSHHLVSLTSTTYGSLLLVEPLKSKLNGRNPPDQPKTHVPADPGKSFSPDSVINTWELMDGLDDDLDFEMGDSLKPKSSFSDHAVQVSLKSSSSQRLGFDESIKKLQDSFDSEKSESFSSSKPLWKHLSEESFLSKMDPNVVSSYRRALSSRQLGYTKETTIVARSVGSSPMNPLPTNNNGFLSHNTEDKIVLYFTSLRGIRKTYEDCCAVRMIFRGFRVPVDEKDISMDASYRKELQSLIKCKAISLPQVFIRGKHIGGVEEIRQLNEAGELANILEGFPVRDPRVVCERCGDARFVPCPNCNGSRKVFDEEEEQLKRCMYCNENGLIRCPGCCCS